MGLPIELGVGLDGVGNYAVTQPSFPNGCHICEVEIDPETGRVALVRYCAVDEMGTLINPLVVHGQIHGGIVQGVGQALVEDMLYDAESGQLSSGSFLDYCMPRADDIPHIELDFLGVPCTTNPLGVKGAGEGGTVGATPAVINAILNALAPLGVTDVRMPATPERVWRAIQEARP